MCRHVYSISILRAFRKWLPGIHNRMTKQKKKDFAQGAANVVKRGAKPSRGTAPVCLVCPVNYYLKVGALHVSFSDLE